MTKIVCSLFSWLMFSVVTSVASDSEFQFSREVVAPELSQDELLSVTLDSSVFSTTRDGLPDLRLLDEQGGVVPFLVRQAQTTRQRTIEKTWVASQAEVQVLDDGGLGIVVQLADDDPIPQGLRLVSRLKNFEHRVRVSSSSDGRQWQPLGEETVIFDYSRYLDVRRDRVEFQSAPDRRIRIEIDDITSEQESELLGLTRRLRGAEETERKEQVTIERRPFRIERIEFWGQTTQKKRASNKTRSYPILGFDVVQETENHRTLVQIGSDREPLTSLKLVTPERNFSRRVAVEVEEKRGAKSAWNTIGTRTLSRIDFKSLQREELTVEFPQSRHASYRLVIDNRDSPPLEVTGIEAKGIEYELLFLASAGRGYRLVYGSEDAESPRYDTAAIEQVLAEGFQAKAATLGTVSPGAISLGESRLVVFRWSSVLNHRGILFGAIVLLVIVLGWGLSHAVKRVEDLPAE